MREEFDLFYEKYEQKCITLGLTVGNEKKRVYYDILDDASVQMKATLDHFGEPAFLGSDPDGSRGSRVTPARSHSTGANSIGSEVVKTTENMQQEHN